MEWKNGCSIALFFLAPLLSAQSPLPPELEELRQPRLTSRSDETVLVVEATGDPVIVGSRAFGLLFQLYYQMPETAKGSAQAAPRARWPAGFDRPRSGWIGLYGLPIPDSVTALPEHGPQPGLDARIMVWRYGEIAEVLHIGPSDREEPTLQRLRELVDAEGYVLLDGHEEEYIRGPTMAGPGDPEQYLTILRYRIAKRLTASEASIWESPAGRRDCEARRLGAKVRPALPLWIFEDPRRP